MVVKVKENFEKTRHVKNSDKSKKYILGGEKKVRFYDRLLSKLRERQQKKFMSDFSQKLHWPTF